MIGAVVAWIFNWFRNSSMRAALAVKIEECRKQRAELEKQMQANSALVSRIESLGEEIDALVALVRTLGG